MFFFMRSDSNHNCNTHVSWIKLTWEYDNETRKLRKRITRNGHSGWTQRSHRFRACPNLSMGANSAVAASCTCRCADLRSLCTMPISFSQPPPWLPMPPECHIIAASPKAKHHTTLEIKRDNNVLKRIFSFLNYTP